VRDEIRVQPTAANILLLATWKLVWHIFRGFRQRRSPLALSTHHDLPGLLRPIVCAAEPAGKYTWIALPSHSS
jgi:hypothetical protein